MSLDLQTSLVSLLFIRDRYSIVSLLYTCNNKIAIHIHVLQCITFNKKQIVV